jgi:hypothetical protein
MTRTHGKSAEESYPFACAAINVAFMLTQVSGIRRRDAPGAPCSDPDAAAIKASIGRMVAKRADNFFDLFVVLLIALDDEWVRTHGTYMKFPIIMNSVRDRCKACLRGNVSSVDTVGKAMGVDLYAAAGDF